jgi:hypothetical protein
LPVKSIDKSAFGVPTGHGGSVCNRIIGTPCTVGANDRARFAASWRIKTVGDNVPNSAA